MEDKTRNSVSPISAYPQFEENDDAHQETAGYWHELVEEKTAANFIKQSHRTLQGLRQKGGGPLFVRLSARCIRYRRLDLRDWIEGKLRKSTSDYGEGKTT